MSENKSHEDLDLTADDGDEQLENESAPTGATSPKPEDPASAPGADAADDETSKPAGAVGKLKRGLGALRRKKPAAEGPKEPVERQAPDADKPEPQEETAEKPQKKKKKKKDRQAVASGNPPITVVLGFVPEATRNDALQHAAGYAEDHLDAPENAWLALSEFKDGYFFELHEGGDGLAYLPQITEQLNTDPEAIVWIPSGSKLNRALTVEMVSGLPYATILTEEESSRIRASGQSSLPRTGKMTRLVKKGERALAIGISIAVLSVITLAGAAWYGAKVDQQPIILTKYNAEILPHGQIVELSSAMRDDRWVSRIVFEEGQWRADFESVEDITLPNDTEEAQKVRDELMALEAGVQGRLSGDEEAEISSPRASVDTAEPPADDEIEVESTQADEASVTIAPDELGELSQELKEHPELFLERLQDKGFREEAMSHAVLRLEAFKNPEIRNYLASVTESNNDEGE